MPFVTASRLFKSLALGLLLHIPAATATTTTTTLPSSPAPSPPSSPSSSSSSSSLSSSTYPYLTPSHTSESVHVIAMATWMVTILAGAVGNVLLCVTIGLNSSLHTAMNTYVFSIGLVDLVTCLGLLPLRIVVESANHEGQEVSAVIEDIEFFLRVFTDIGRLLLMQSLTLERYQAIASPFAVTKSQARRRAKIVILFQGLLSLLVAALSVRYLCDTTLHYHCSIRASLTSTTTTSSHNTTIATSTTSTKTAIPTSPARTTPSNNSSITVTTTTISNPIYKDVLSSEWGLLETYIELPLTLITVAIIFASYTFILTISRQQKKKLSNHSNAHKPKKHRDNQISPAMIGSRSDLHHQSGTSNKDDTASAFNTFPRFINVLEANPPSLNDKPSSPITSLKTSHEISNKTRKNMVSLSLSELQKSVGHVTQRKYSLPGKEDGGLHGKHYTGNSDMRVDNANAGDNERLQASMSFHKRKHLTECKQNSLNIPTSSIQQGVDNPAFDDISIAVGNPKHEDNDITTGDESISLEHYSQHQSERNLSSSNNCTKEKKDNTVNANTKDSIAPNALSTISRNEMDQSITSVQHSCGTSGRKPSEEDNSNRIAGAVCLMNNKNKLLGRRGVELKSAFKVGFLFCCFVCLWMPFPVTVAIIRAFVSSGKYQTFMDVAAILSSLATCTAAIDAIVYGLFNQQIMDRVVNLNKTCRRRLTTTMSRWF